MNSSADDSPRSHAIAGLKQIALASPFFAGALLGIRFHVKVPWYTGGTLPLELVEGVAAIVIFLGLLHLVIALVAKRQRNQ